jgi:gluconate 5-dehydrogenase
MQFALFSLEKQLALITGSSQGIGLALAGGLAAHGAEVILNGRNAGRLEAAASRLRETGATVHISTFDVTDPAAVEDGVAAIESRIGPISILVNNAGMQMRKPMTDFSAAEYRLVQSTNVDSMFFVSQSVLKRMSTRGRGKIINVGSVQSELGRASIVPYATSKGAVKMMTRAMCAEFAASNVQVNGLGPGYIDTELTRALVADHDFTEWLSKRTPAGRWGKVDELIGAAVFLASAASDFVNGQMLYVDGGMTAVV